MARKEKIAAAEEDGCPVVVGSKRRKKTRDLQSGIMVAPVSPAAAVTENATKRSKKESPLDVHHSQELQSRRNDFFMPISKRRKCKDEQAEENLPEIRNAPPKLKIVKTGKAAKPPLEVVHPVTRLEKGKNSASTSLPGNAVQGGEHNLRLEAVLAAQENARWNVGKTMHPFFARKNGTSLKTSVIGDETLSYQAEHLQPGPPIHVTQSSVDERIEVTWRDWKFTPPGASEVTKVDEFCKVEHKRYRLMQHCLPSTLAQHDQQLDSHAVSTNSTKLAASGAATIDETFGSGSESTNSLRALQDLLTYRQTLKTTTEVVGVEAQLAEVLKTVGTDISLENLKDRFFWYSARHDTLNSADRAIVPQTSKESHGEAAPSSRNVLWTDKYQPKSSKEVCGNSTAVEVLSSWLYNWQQKISGQPIKGEDVEGIHGDKNDNYDSDKGWFEGDSDVDSDAEGVNGLHNTLLITGPAGCGKSATVYACAAEQGFRVIEVNASECRNGAVIKSKFGEAGESHGLGKVPQAGVAGSLLPVSKNALKVQDSSPGPSKENVTKEKKAVVDKGSVSRSPLKAHQGGPVASQDESQMDIQGKSSAVILFEDVDKHFEEDKGFLTALVQLSKAAKRPIILTSNRPEPGLPPVLEKFRIDFDYPTSEELVLHACLVCIAEGVTCSPRLVKCMVDSCQNDLRKVMMALQFWRQGKAPVQQSSLLSRPTGCLDTPNDSGHHQHYMNGTSNRLKRESKKPLNLCRSSEMSLAYEQAKQAFGKWDSDARWLFELDLHHLVLPKVISGSFVCPLNLLVGEKICTAVRKEDEQAAQVAARKTEARAQALQAIEVTRKALKKGKDALRRGALSEARALEGSTREAGVIPNEGIEVENCCSENWVYSPTKSIREAKSLARSPLKSKMLRSRRALLLCDSDDEEQLLPRQAGGSIEAGTQSITNMEPNLLGVQILINDSIDILGDVVTESLEDLDVAHSSLSEAVVTVSRKRLRKKDSVRLNNLTNLESLPGRESVQNDGKISPEKLKTSGMQTDVSVREGQLANPTILPVKSDSLLVDVDQIVRLNTELNVFMPSGSEVAANFESGKQLAAQNLGLGGDKDIEALFSSQGGQLVDNTSSNTPTLQLPDSSEGCNHVNVSVLHSDPVPQRCRREEIVGTGENDLLKNEVLGRPGGFASEIVTPVTRIPFTKHSEIVEGIDTEPADLSPSTNGNGNSQESKAGEGSVSDLFDPVKEAWTSLRDSRHTLKSLMVHAQTSADVTSSLSDLLDVISASDVISSVQTEDFKDAQRSFDGIVSEAFEGNIGHCRDWDGCQEIASQLVRTGLQHSLTFLPAVKHVDFRLPVLSCILECAKDAPAVGQCMVTSDGLRSDSYLSSKLYGMIDGTYARVNSTRQADRQARLEDVVQNAVKPRGIVSRSGLVEYSAYLSRISQLEEVRRTHGSCEGRRPRKFEHHLTSKLKSLTDSDITELLKCSTFRNS